ncbi:MAG: hypothetical protein NBV67_13005 [Tagaea sp.]|nr:hypothetical protein [Tagaea sp.]
MGSGIITKKELDGLLGRMGLVCVGSGPATLAYASKRAAENVATSSHELFPLPKPEVATLNGELTEVYAVETATTIAISALGFLARTVEALKASELISAAEFEAALRRKYFHRLLGQPEDVEYQIWQYKNPDQPALSLPPLGVPRARYMGPGKTLSHPRRIADMILQRADWLIGGTIGPDPSTPTPVATAIIPSLPPSVN